MMAMAGQLLMPLVVRDCWLTPQNKFLPKARVIYNDFDGYADRLQNINDTNQLRKIIF